MKKLAVGVRGKLSEVKDILNTSTSDFIKEIFIGAPKKYGSTGRIETYETDTEELKHIIEYAHSFGVEVNVVLNAVKHDLGNTKQLEMIREFTTSMEDIGADYITLRDYFLIQTALRTRTTIKVNVSVFADVTDPLLAKEYNDMGVDRINVPAKINRDINLIRRICNITACDIEMYVNSKCVNCGACPYASNHYNFYEQSRHNNDWKKPDPYLAMCSSRRNRNPIEQIFTSMIRPEDITLFESIGVSVFKLGTRTQKPEVVVELVHAYGSRKYDGLYFELWSNTKGIDKYRVNKRLLSIPNSRFDGLLEQVIELPVEEQKQFYEKEFKDEI
jgi:collagenase-like PrtC family protease